MKRILAVLAISAVMPFSGAAQAQDFPEWPLRSICNTGELNCPRYEVHTRGKVSGVWASLPPEVRKQCLGEIKALQPSYRLLKSCLANAMQELLRDQHRKPPSGQVVHKTPMAKRPEPPAPVAPPAPPAEPAPQATPAPATPAPPQ
jgi:hypothetical protein